MPHRLEAKPRETLRIMQIDVTAPAPQAVVLPEGYYHTHFLLLVGTAGSRYADLLTESERAIVSDFLCLPCDAQKLFVRLTNRVGPWFVVAKLCYPEIGDCAVATRTLADRGFIEGIKSCTAAESLGTLTVAELKRAFGKVRGAAGRDALVDAIVATFDEGEILLRVRARVGEIVRPCHGVTVRLLQFLFFGNTGQGMTDFVLADMGLMRYETYALDASTRAFSCRVSADHALVARQAYDGLFEALEIGREKWTVEALLEARDVALSRASEFHPRAQRRLSKTLNLLGNRLERAGACAEALPCYVASVLPPARERVVRLLEKRGDREGAVALALETLASSLDEGELAFAYRYLVKTARIPPASLPLPACEADLMRYFLGTKNTLDAWPQRKLDLPPTLRRIGVEEATLFALSDEGYEGVHSENLPWCALFGLVFWEEIFAPVPGAFHHPYQLGPSDASSPEFRAARADACEATLAAFTCAGFDMGLLEARWRAKEGIANRWIHWPALTWDLMEKFIAGCPRQGLALVLARMLRHPGRFHSGFPDLFLWRDGKAEFWEVKGPGDQLRPHQKSWLAFLGNAGLSVGVCVVEFSPGRD